MIQRKIQSVIEENFGEGKALIILGARQVGKTTLLKMLMEKHKDTSIYLNCDEPDIRLQLTNVTSTQLKNLVGNNKLVFIDEAQRVKDIGITLKLFVDNIPNCQVIATGSSALELSNEINEPLTGRIFEFRISPLSIEELNEHSGWLETNRLLEERIIYGMYPEIITRQNKKEKLLSTITSSYLFKDLLAYQKIRKPETLEKLLTVLALQISNQVSYNELSNLLKIDKDTIEKYVELLEKTFVVYRLKPFSKNLRTEIRKMRKIYFWDTGIRNALISDFKPMSLRQDVGALWENFLISERLKYNHNRWKDVKSYFWRTQQKQEIDYLENDGEKITAFEFKWNPQSKPKIPKTFISTYPEIETLVINTRNYSSFVK